MNAYNAHNSGCAGFDGEYGGLAIVVNYASDNETDNLMLAVFNDRP